MNINKIRLSGTTYSIQDLNATKTVELTQAEYDGLSVKDPNTFYIITDATAGDLSNYYTKSETSGATEISTALASKADTATTYTKTETDNAITAATSTKQDTLVSGTNIKTINNQSILGEGNIEIQGGSGGGKAVSAGTNISITTGDTTDTINCTLPITASTSIRKNDIAIGNDIINGAYSYNKITIGNGNKFKYASSRTSNSILIGTPSSNSSMYNVVKASYCIGIGGNKLEVGYDDFNGYGSIAIGFGAKSNINKSLAIGYNTVASGTTQTNINNQLTIDTSNQVYIYNKDNTEMICLQDQLGGGGGSTYTAGDGIDITNNVISVTGKVDTSAITTTITSSSTDAQVPSAKAVNDQLGGLKLVKLTQSEYSAMEQAGTLDNSTLYIVIGS